MNRKAVIQNTPLVSVIIPSMNSARFIGGCLESISNQTYKNIEIILIDNNSSDNTKKIGKTFTNKVYNKGPERSAQVNFGVTKASGDFVYKVDSDFTLDPKVIEECVAKANEGYDAVVVHNTPNANVSWIARLRKFEVDMYKYDHLHSSPRFIRKTVYEEVGGFNELITAGEDYDFRNRIDAAGYKTGFIDAEALHHGEPTSFWAHMKKYFQYGKDIKSYSASEHNNFAGESASFLGVYVKNWRTLIRHPFKSIGLLLYTGCKALFGLAGWLTATIKGGVA